MIPHRLADESQALPEVALEEPVHVIGVLHEERPVQPQLVPNSLRRLPRCTCCPSSPGRDRPGRNVPGRKVISDYGHQHAIGKKEQPSDDVYPHEPMLPRRTGLSNTAQPSPQPAQPQLPPHDTLSHPKRQRAAAVAPLSFFYHFQLSLPHLYLVITMKISLG